jgi:hypothetical protein
MKVKEKEKRNRRERKEDRTGKITKRRRER